jgi:hypothetical protein
MGLAIQPRLSDGPTPAARLPALFGNIPRAGVQNKYEIAR